MEIEILACNAIFSGDSFRRDLWFMGPWKVFRLFLFFGLNNNFTESIHIPKFYLILFYHSKKLLYQLYHTILQYSQHLNFYFTIQHIRITFLHNKIIYPKTQIKTKAQKPRERENKILVFFFFRIELHCNSTFRIAL